MSVDDDDGKRTGRKKKKKTKTKRKKTRELTTTTSASTGSGSGSDTRRSKNSHNVGRHQRDRYDSREEEAVNGTTVVFQGKEHVSASASTSASVSASTTEDTVHAKIRVNPLDTNDVVKGARRDEEGKGVVAYVGGDGNGDGNGDGSESTRKTIEWVYPRGQGDHHLVPFHLKRRRREPKDGGDDDDDDDKQEDGNEGLQLSSDEKSHAKKRFEPTNETIDEILLKISNNKNKMNKKNHKEEAATKDDGENADKTEKLRRLNGTGAIAIPDENAKAGRETSSPPAVTTTMTATATTAETTTTTAKSLPMTDLSTLDGGKLSGVSVEDAVKDHAGRRPRANSTDNELNLPQRGLCDELLALQSHLWTDAWYDTPTRGFYNLGNTCFLNATVKCLSYLPPFCQCILLMDPLQNQRPNHQHHHHDHHHPNHQHHSPSGGDHTQHKKLSPGQQITAIMRRLLRQLHSTKKNVSSIEPKELVNALPILGKIGTRNGCKFRLGRQEDAHEFLVHLLEAMQDGELRAAGIDQRVRGWRDRLPIPRLDETTFVHRIFGGYLRSQVKCTRCGYRSNTYDPFLDLALEISKKSSNSILGAFREFTRVETLDLHNQWKCSGCKKKVCAEKQLTMFRPPLSLCIQLKRFAFDGVNHHFNGFGKRFNGFGGAFGAAGGGSGGTKITKDIDFQARMKLPLSDGRKCEYDLTGIVVHVGGSASSGHYTAFVKKPGPTGSKQWYHMDDSFVEAVSEKKVLFQKNAYLLFYCRSEVTLALPVPPPRASMSAEEAKEMGQARARSRADSITRESDCETKSPEKTNAHRQMEKRHTKYTADDSGRGSEREKTPGADEDRREGRRPSARAPPDDSTSREPGSESTNPGSMLPEKGKHVGQPCQGAEVDTILREPGSETPNSLMEASSPIGEKTPRAEAVSEKCWVDKNTAKASPSPSASSSPPSSSSQSGSESSSSADDSTPKENARKRGERTHLVPEPGPRVTLTRAGEDDHLQTKTATTNEERTGSENEQEAILNKSTHKPLRPDTKDATYPSIQIQRTGPPNAMDRSEATPPKTRIADCAEASSCSIDRKGNASKTEREPTRPPPSTKVVQTQVVGNRGPAIVKVDPKRRAQKRAWIPKGASRGNQDDGNSSLLGSIAVSRWDDDAPDHEAGSSPHGGPPNRTLAERDQLVAQMKKEERKRKSAMHLDRSDAILDQGRRKKVKSKKTAPQQGHNTSHSKDAVAVNRFHQIQVGIQSMNRGRPKGFGRALVGQVKNNASRPKGQSSKRRHTL